MNIEKKLRVVKSFKDYEIFSQLRIPPDIFFIVRCDGRAFKELCKVAGFKKPFDEDLAKLMVSTGKAVYEGGLNPLFSLIHSDEVNLLFNGEFLFNRRVEKLLSIIPSLMSSKASLSLKSSLNYEGLVAFDARLVILNESEIVDYFIWRQMEAWRNHVNAYAHYALVSKGLFPREASMKLKGLKSHQLHELVFKEMGINLASTPAWQRRGIALIWEEEFKEGFDPLRKVKVETLRLRLKEDWNPPLFAEAEGRAYIERSINLKLKANSSARLLRIDSSVREHLS